MCFVVCWTGVGFLANHCLQMPSSMTRTSSASSTAPARSAASSARAVPSAAPVAVAGLGLLSLAGASASRSKKSKKSVVSLRARGGEEDTRVCIPLEETESWYPLCKCRLMRVGWFNLPAAQHQKPRLRVGEASSTSEFPNVHENHLPSHWLLHPTQKVLAWGESARQELRNTDVEKVGGKSASLGEMISQLSDVGVPVPGGDGGWLRDLLDNGAGWRREPEGEQVQGKILLVQPVGNSK